MIVRSQTMWRLGTPGVALYMHVLYAHYSVIWRANDWLCTLAVGIAFEVMLLANYSTSEHRLSSQFSISTRLLIILCIERQLGECAHGLSYLGNTKQRAN